MAMELKCAYQQYDWGKFGLNSKVASLLKCAEPELIIDENRPYAELWMGTHPNGPSIVKSTGEKLLDWIEGNSQALGRKVVSSFGIQLPFLFKVLSINKALSIQAHPTKAHAEILHQKYPDLYKDPNHKPELAIALTDFEALCGFRPAEVVKNFMRHVPELREVCGLEVTSQFLCSEQKDAEHNLKVCFTALMKCEPSKIEKQLSHLLERLDTLDDDTRTLINGDLFRRLHMQFPGDVGCFSIYLLNHIILKPEEAIYLGPNEPHAYLSGDCVECMACSDNVVRAGLTPKYKDVDTLCNMLNYKGAPAGDKLFKPIGEDLYTQVYKPPVPDFAVAKISVPAEKSNYNLIRRDCACILIVIEGEANTNLLALRKGTVLFLRENQELTIQKVTRGKGITLYQAFCNV
ncbi:mannose-6-phosphate isomerase [Schistocerca piceifrons]|uniref:mannose-6-phosphate isomerase n=1 Tax=Schistocerca piceifrons TaxID=274613 RepID=UPI001F5FBDD2|nr:mannose-6-phosphate isomerase [Schistocerca piceifrons]XP_047097697.1 mannose-6-phosphate isomerase [Schistocerca piceifrons]XP_047097705.1 mannose-6-phosphate isomerase [Schistocerca piceifrons]